MRRRPRVAQFVVLYLVLESILPGVILLEGGSQFRWAMFENYRPVPRFAVETTGGVSVVELDDIVVRARGDVDYAEVVPPHLCATTPQAVSVRTEAAGQVIGVYRCTR